MSKAKSEMRELVGTAEYQVWRHFGADPEGFGLKADCHIFPRPVDAVFFLSQLEPVGVREDGTAAEDRYLTRVVRYKPVRRATAKPKPKKVKP